MAEGEAGGGDAVDQEDFLPSFGAPFIEADCAILVLYINIKIFLFQLREKKDGGCT